MTNLFKRIIELIRIVIINYISGILNDSNDDFYNPDPTPVPNPNPIPEPDPDPDDFDYIPVYYGCPNSKRTKKLQLKKESLKR